MLTDNGIFTTTNVAVVTVSFLDALCYVKSSNMLF